MNFWTAFYFFMSTKALGLAAASRDTKLAAGASIIFLSWLMTNTVLMSQNPERTFLVYFAFDIVAAEALAFMLLHRFSAWTAVFLLATYCQLGVHLAYWAYTPPPRRYHEILNGFYWAQFIAVDIAALAMMFIKPANKATSFKPRARPEPTVIFIQPEPWAPRGPRMCPVLIRAYA